MKRRKTITAIDSDGDVGVRISVEVMVKHRSLTRGESRALLNKIVDSAMFDIKNAPYIDTSFAEMTLT